MTTIRPRTFLCALLLAAAPAGAADLLVGNKAGGSVWRLSAADGDKRDMFPTGDGPHEIAVSGNRRFALVSNYGGADSPGNTLSVIDLRNGATRRILLGEHARPHGMRVLPGDREALVTTEDSRKLLVVDIAKGAVTAAIDLGEGRGHMVALDAAGAFAYVTKIDAGTVSRIDVAARAKTAEASAGAGAEGVAVRPGGEVWVTNREAGTVTVHDPATLAVLRTIDSPGFPIRVAFDAGGRHALVTNARAATLSVIDAEAKAPLRTIDLAAPGAEYRETMLGKAALPIGVAADPKRSRVYVAISGGDEVAVIDTRTWTVVRRWKTGAEPDALGLVD